MVLLLCLAALAATDVPLTVGDKKLSVAELSKLSPIVTVAARDDEYGGRTKKYKAFLLAPVLEKAFGKKDFGDDEALLTALDGYVVSLPMQKLVTERAYIAVDDVDVPGFEAVGPKKVNPGPYYLVWAKDQQHDLTQFPRPYQLASIARASYESRFPHTLPPANDAAAQAGFRIFKSVCVHCHAVNREGGRVGPELNVPKNVLEYWSEAQVKAYVKNPSTFRYGNMPPQPQLNDVDLDHLIAYLRAMQKAKFDAPEKTP